jgi:hypothetical protein
VAIQAFLDAPPAALAHLGQTAQQVLTQRFTQDYLCGKFCDELERALGFAPAPPAAKSSSRSSANVSPNAHHAVVS